MNRLCTLPLSARSNRTALLLAVKGNDEEFLNFLLASRPGVDLTDNEERTPSALAHQNRHDDTARAVRPKQTKK